jgi:hypothetical protein
MANPNLSKADLKNLLEMVINAPVGSYINAVSRQPLVNRFVEFHNQIQQGARADALSPAEVAAVDAVRNNAAKAAQPAAGVVSTRGGTVVSPAHPPVGA